jgi:hypothetical protein
MKMSKIALVVFLTILIYILYMFLISKCSCKKKVTFKDPVVDKIKLIPANEPQTAKSFIIDPNVIIEQLRLFGSKDNKSSYTDLTNYL